MFPCRSRRGLQQETFWVWLQRWGSHIPSKWVPFGIRPTWGSRCLKPVPIPVPMIGPNNSPTPLKFNSYCGISWYAVNHKLHMISESSQTRGDQGIWSRIVETPELISRSFDVFENIWRTLLHRFALLDVFQRHGKLACDLQSWIQESSPMKLHEGSCYMPKGAKRPSGLVVVRHLQNVGYTHRLQAQSRLHSEIWLQSSIYIYMSVFVLLVYIIYIYIYIQYCVYI